MRLTLGLHVPYIAGSAKLRPHLPTIVLFRQQLQLLHRSTSYSDAFFASSFLVYVYLWCPTPNHQTTCHWPHFCFLDYGRHYHQRHLANLEIPDTQCSWFIQLSYCYYDDCSLSGSILWHFHTISVDSKEYLLVGCFHSIALLRQPHQEHASSENFLRGYSFVY